MGYMRHHAIVVTGFDGKHVRRARDQAVRLDMCVSDISSSPVNGYSSFCVFPDGSKEGWTDSHEGDARRDLLVEWMKSRFDEGYLDWAEVQYGDDDYDTRVVRHSDEGRVDR
jgi:hypothetical protein